MTTDWQSWTAHGSASLDDLAAMARRVYDELPEEFRALTGNVVIEVTDWPSAEMIEELEADSPYDILGLFQGIGRIHEGATSWTGRLPNMIWLYRQPILAFCRESEDSLEDVVAHVLIHEIGHHFGLSDEDMERIENGEVL